MNNIKVFADGIECPLSVSVFPSGGELNVMLGSPLPKDPFQVVVKATIKSSDDLFAIALVNDAIRRGMDTAEVILLVMWVPYARQDRVCNKGEALSSLVVANYINHLEFDRVEIADPHSDVLPALINNCKIFSQSDIICNSMLADKISSAEYVLVSPDAGANKKTLETAKRLSAKRIIKADKVRDTLTGRITSTQVYANEYELLGANCLIVDDICDGGYTFTELAKVLRAKGANTVNLYVTHGLFTKGLDDLKKLFDNIYTTNSVYLGDDVHIINIEY